MRTVYALLTGVAAAFVTAMWGIFSSVCVFVPHPFTTKKEGRAMSMTRVVLVFTFVLLALAIALPQAAFAQGAGKALDFDGVNDYVQIGSINITDDITIEAWFK